MSNTHADPQSGENPTALSPSEELIRRTGGSTDPGEPPSRRTRLLRIRAPRSLSEAVPVAIIVPAINAGYHLVSHKSPPLPGVDQIRIKTPHYTVTQSAEAFFYDQKFLVRDLSTIGVSKTRSSMLRIYLVGKDGSLNLLYTFAPRLGLQKGLGTASTRQFIPDGVDIDIVGVRDFNGSGGTQVLLNLIDPQEPYLAVILMLLSEVQPDHLTGDITFTVQPLLSPACRRGAPASTRAQAGSAVPVFSTGDSNLTLIRGLLQHELPTPFSPPRSMIT